MLLSLEENYPTGLSDGGSLLGMHLACGSVAGHIQGTGSSARTGKQGLERDGAVRSGDAWALFAMKGNQTPFFLSDRLPSGISALKLEVQGELFA